MAAAGTKAETVTTKTKPAPDGALVTPSSRCKQCDRPLIEIDNYGERLVGCIECNRWTWRGSKTLIELPEADLEALKAVNKEKLG